MKKSKWLMKKSYPYPWLYWKKICIFAAKIRTELDEHRTATEYTE